jgi:hypothetical protein
MRKTAVYIMNALMGSKIWENLYVILDFLLISQEKFVIGPQMFTALLDAPIE